jgi:hypothetical protein
LNVLQRGFKSWCENVARQQRRELKLRPSDSLDPLRLAQHLEVEVHTADEVPGISPECLRILTIEDADSWSAATLSGSHKDVIILNPAHSRGRVASDLTHELAHILIGHRAARVDVSADGRLLLSTYDKNQEDEAAWLAGCLLLPRDAIILIRSHRLDLNLAATNYGVSLDMLRYRINVTGVDRQLRRALRSGGGARRA